MSEHRWESITNLDDICPTLEDKMNFEILKSAMRGNPEFKTEDDPE